MGGKSIVNRFLYIHVAVWLIVVYGIGANALGITYYVSTQGNDNAVGTDMLRHLYSLDTALSRVNDGDRILLCRGDVFRKRLSDKWSVNKTITIGAYGGRSFDRPVLSGARIITNWQPYKGNIYVAQVTDSIRMLFVDGDRMLFARYPNTGWLWRDKEGNDSLFTCSELRNHPRNSDNYWTGAMCRYRAMNWWYTRTRVYGYNAATTRIHTNRMPIEGFGFYFDQKFEELDTAGEWYFDTAEKKVYLYAPGGKDPNNCTVEGVINAGCFSSRKIDAKFEDLCIQYFAGKPGIYLNKRAHITRCTFRKLGCDDGGGGVSSWYNTRYNYDAKGSSITHCRFEDIIAVPIGWCENPEAGGPSTIFQFDTLKDIMMIPGYGHTGSQNWSHSGIVIHCGRDITIKNCYLENIAYAGILLGGSSQKVGEFYKSEQCVAEYNILKNCMCLLNDGGAIYIVGHNHIVRNNLVFDTRGSLNGQGPWIHVNITNGIWPEFLEDFSGIIIENNTVANTGNRGLFLRNNFDCIIRNNVFYGNDVTQMIISNNATNERTNRTENLAQNHLIENNVFVATSPEASAIIYRINNADTTRLDFNFGLFRDNYFCNPYTNKVVWRFKSWGRYDKLTLDEWQSKLTCADKSHKTDPVKRPAYTSAEDLRGTTKLVYNDHLSTRAVPLDNGIYVTLYGDTVRRSIVLEPYTSAVLYHTGELLSVEGKKMKSPFVQPFHIVQNVGISMISLNLDARSVVTISVFNILGQRVVYRTCNGMSPGIHRIALGNKKTGKIYLPKGIYYCSAVITTERSRTRRNTKFLVK